MHRSSLPTFHPAADWPDRLSSHTCICGQQLLRYTRPQLPRWRTFQQCQLWFVRCSPRFHRRFLREQFEPRHVLYMGYAREWDLPVNPLIDSISVMGSLATGYYTEQTPYEWMPMGAISFKHSFDSQQGLRLSYLPGIGKSTVNYVLHLSYEFRLK